MEGRSICWDISQKSLDLSWATPASWQSQQVSKSCLPGSLRACNLRFTWLLFFHCGWGTAPSVLSDRSIPAGHLLSHQPKRSAPFLELANWIGVWCRSQHELHFGPRSESTSAILPPFTCECYTGRINRRRLKSGGNCLNFCMAGKILRPEFLESAMVLWKWNQVSQWRQWNVLVWSTTQYDSIIPSNSGPESPFYTDEETWTGSIEETRGNQ